MTIKHTASSPDEHAAFQSEMRARRYHMPDAVASDAEDAMENLGRCIELVRKIKTIGCRGDDMAAIEAVVVKDEAYNLRVALEDALRKLEKAQ
jgi:hypothetical protein